MHERHINLITISAWCHCDGFLRLIKVQILYESRLDLKLVGSYTGLNARSIEFGVWGNWVLARYFFVFLF